MKEATGELSMTVITIIAVIAIMLIITTLTPLIRDYINKTWDNISNTTAAYVEIYDNFSNM